MNANTNSPYVSRDHYAANTVTTPLNHNNNNNNNSLNNPQVKVMHDWLDACAAQSIQIWCGDPIMNTERIAGGVLGGRTYFTYCIHYKQNGRDMTLVRHRYSEFEAIRTELKDRYHQYGILVPALPPKQALLSVAVSNLLANDDDTFVKERTLGLTLFCENIVNSPWIRNDNSWKAFLRPNSTTDASMMLSTLSQENVGEVQLKHCLDLLSLPSKSLILEKMEYIRSEVNAIEKNARNMLEKVRVIQKFERALQTAQEQLRDSLESFATTEKQIKFLGGRSLHDIPSQVILPQDMVSNSANSLFKMVQSKCESEHDLTGYTGLTLVVALEQELSLAEALKELIKIYDDLSNAIETLSNKVRTVSKVDQVLEFKRLLEEKERCLEVFCTGFVYFSVPLAARQRAANARRFFSGYVATNTSAAYSTYKACTEFFHSLLMSSHIANEEISKWFVSSGQRPLAKLPVSEATGKDSDAVMPLSPYPHRSDYTMDTEKASSISFLPATPKAANGSSQKSSWMGSAAQDLTYDASDNIEANEGNFNRNNAISAGNTIRGLNISPGFHGMSGLFSRALMLSRGIQPSPSPMAISSMAAASNALHNSASGSNLSGNNSINGNNSSHNAANNNESTSVSIINGNGNNNNPLAMRRGSAILGLRKQQSEDGESIAAAMAAASNSSTPTNNAATSESGQGINRNPLARRTSAVLNNRKQEDETPREAMTSEGIDSDLAFEHTSRTDS